MHYHLLTLLILIFFGLAPSIVWLSLYLRKDTHPEPKQMIIKVFLLGAAISPLAALIECIPSGFSQKGELICHLLVYFSQCFHPPLGIFLYLMLIIAPTEEIIKYLVVRWKVIRSKEFDEPVDIMIYMIVAALGFAALENILVLFPLRDIVEMVSTSVLRFIGATFLHALCSGLIGYYLALSFFETKKRTRLILTGFGLAILLHGLYDSFIMIGGELELIGPLTILIGLFISVFLGFKKVKKMKSVCLM